MKPALLALTCSALACAPAHPSSDAYETSSTSSAEQGVTASTIVPDLTSTFTSVDATSGAGDGSATGASDPDGDDDTGVAATDGWIEIPDTALTAVCPPASDGYDFPANCKYVVEAWSGGLADTARDRLIVWGGGHTNYNGNELYALDLDQQNMVRLNHPSPIDNVESCPFTYVDGTPSSRHTYDALAYIEHADRMFAFGGSRATCGGFADDTWTLDLETLQWHDMQPAGEHPGGYPGMVVDYDVETKAVFVHDTYVLWRYDYDSNTYTRLAESFLDYHMTGRIDPVHRAFVIAGGKGSELGGFKRISIAEGSDHALEDISEASGCDDLVSAPSPGLAWDPVSEQLVGWAGGPDVFAIDLDVPACTRYTAEGGPGPAQEYGTFGRWRYFADEGVFAVVNAADGNAFAFRFNPS